MLTLETRNQITALVRRWVVPAMGCTEPICVALATAKATEVLGTVPVNINVSLSANILKNAMGVGIPGTGMVGLPIAISLGTIVGKSEYGLEVIKDCTPADVEKAKAYMATDCINITLNNETQEKLYVEVVCKAADGNTSRVVIEREHTNICCVEKNGESVTSKDQTTQNPTENIAQEQQPILTLRTVYEYATSAPLDEIEFINEA